MEVTAEALLGVICSQKICNAGRAAVSDCRCHGYPGRFSLKASSAAAAAASSAAQLAARSHLSVFHKGRLHPQGEQPGGERRRRACGMLCSAASLLRAGPCPRGRALCLRSGGGHLGPAAGRGAFWERILRRQVPACTCQRPEQSEPLSSVPRGGYWNLSAKKIFLSYSHASLPLLFQIVLS